MPVAGERLRSGFADAAAGAGNDCDPAHKKPPDRRAS
jgi:hypothetical protein